MGKLTRAFDWASTPLGAPETWQQSLRSAVSIVLNSRFPMFIWWGPDHIQFYNDAYRPSLANDGKHPLALGQRGEDCWPEIWPVIFPLISQVLDGGDATWSEDQLIPIYRNGRMEDVYWTFSYSPLLDDNGRVAGVLVVCNENTEKMLHLRQLEESEDQLRFAIEAAELATFDYNPLTDKFVANSRLREWFGLPFGEEIELPVAIGSIVPGDRERVSNAIRRVLEYESGGYYDIKYTVVSGDTGQERIVRAKGRAYFNEEKIAYRFNGTLQDITEQEIASIKLAQAEQTARLAIESAALGTYSLNLQTGELITSPRYNAIFASSMAVERQAVLAMVHPDDMPIRDKANEESLKTGVVDYSIRFYWPDGSLHWMKVNGRVLFDEQGKPYKRVGVVQDITEQKEFAELLTQQVYERTLELQRSNEDLMQFAHVITHDLKEPVRKVRVYSSRMQEELDEVFSAKGRLFLDKIRHATDRMVAMIEGVLHYSKVNVLDDAIEPVNLGEVVYSIRADLEIPIQQRNARIELSGAPVIHGIPILLYQLFYNLINNSLKFSRKEAAPVIAISGDIIAERGRSFVRIVLSDNGIGFDQQFAAAIFHPFTRLNRKDEYEGTGLGLALCKKIVERHRGSISVMGTPGEGASFTILLPQPK